jgi:hypothetical protein
VLDLARAYLSLQAPQVLAFTLHFKQFWTLQLMHLPWVAEPTTVSKNLPEKQAVHWVAEEQVKQLGSHVIQAPAEESVNFSKHLVQILRLVAAQFLHPFMLHWKVSPLESMVYPLSV